MPDWDILFKKEKHRWVKPSDCVVDLVKHLKGEGARLILDLGCGAGRHTVFLGKAGFSVVGLDISREGLRETLRRVRSAGVEGSFLARGTVTRLPHRGACFDAVVSINVIHHGTLRDINRTIKEVQRVLRGGGLFLATLASLSNAKYGVGRQVEEGTFLTDVGEEAGVVHHFFSEDEARRLFGGFELLKIEEGIESSPDGVKTQPRPDHWRVLARAR